MAEPIEVLFGVWTRLIPRNHVLDGGPDPPCTGTILRGGEMAVTYWFFSSIVTEEKLWGHLLLLSLCMHTDFA